jgi:glycerol-3-phosphate dehydrogenase
MAGIIMNISDIKGEYDVVVVGGGITGAGVFHEAVRRGYKTLLVEEKDFAWGTSSRSSKMVHGGLRYLKQGKFLLTKASVKERERLLIKYPGLVTPLNFIMPIFDHYGPSESSMRIGLSIYSMLAGKKQHRSYSRTDTMNTIAGIREKNLVSAVGFQDAQVDDARLVLRLIYEACLSGGNALNYTKAINIERNQKKKVSAVNIEDIRTGSITEIKTKVLVNATGAFVETLHPSPETGLHIRPLRGSHLIFPGTLFPLNKVISFVHPQDLRPVFLFPWEGSLCLGTTDIDHDQNIENDPFITINEADYLIDGLKHVLPDLNISIKDCISSFAGVRPVLSKNKNKSASKESREHVVWKDKGLITVAGGKLTTFSLLANDALKAAKSYLPGKHIRKPIQINLGSNQMGIDQDFPKGSVERLRARYGHMAPKILRQYDEKLFSPIENTDSLWVEICYAAEHEDIHNLSDLLLRRVRIGLFLPQGGSNQLDKIETFCKPYLSWDKKRWEIEKAAYVKVWDKYYSPPKRMEL